MSRETDRSSSGPQGRGGSSYPPGTEPYGPGAAGDSADSEEAAASDTQRRPEDRKTETTLTTRIRINIPGSRPIPPVVMRTPVSEGETGGGKADGAAGGPEQRGASPDDAHPLRAPGDGVPGTGPGAGPGGGAGAPGSPGSGPGAGAGAPGSSRASEDTSAGGEFTQETSDWFAPRKAKPSSGSSGSGTGAGAGSGVGAGPLTGPRPGGPAGPGPGTPPGADLPYGGRDGQDPYGVQNPYGVGDSYGSGDPYDTGSYSLPRTDTPPGGTPAPGGPAEPGAGQGQDGPTTGPVSGDMPLPPPLGQGGAPPESPASSTLGLGTGRAPFAPGGVGEEMLAREPGGSGGLPAYGGSNGSRDGVAVEDDADGDRIVSETLMSRAPRLADEDSIGTSGSPFERASSKPAVDRGDASSGGRSKLMIAGVAVLGVVGIAYGAGLLLDHADVPNGTTVLGVEIGGMSRHEAVNKLDAAFGDRTTQAFTVVAGDKRTKLKPSVAGMTLDTEATVRSAAGRDYNPVSVIGSLFGVERDAEPALKVDKEKMASALSQVSKETGIGGGAPKDGMVKFVDGKAVAVPGKTHKGIDTGKASKALQKAYRTRAATGNNSPVELPVALQQPKVGKKEIARAIREFGKPAMSGLVTIKAGDASIQFSPEKSLPKFLSMKPVNGTLVDTYDLPVLRSLYGTTFDGVKITRGDGSKTPVSPQDVAGALRLALKETSPAKRVQEIPLKPQ
ncbi:peptidoglycan binding domain-containing protein [Streptomyces winkii]|uniref:peptidoglycan binding domain-containing protein n=1 Tax=Streptomyces winkii TaxID=3051178 RepID=UPI0028D90B2A|nr:hypothetical protein [Streptomyces sp. DSM 40971]